VRKCPALKWFTPTLRRCGRKAEQQQRRCFLAQSPLGATRVCLAGSQAAAAWLVSLSLAPPAVARDRELTLRLGRRK
jgi:hypothetical protein